MSKAKQTRYILVDAKTGEPVTMTHQDDMETALSAGSLYGLLDKFGDWCDCGLDYVLKNLKGDEIRDPANDANAVYKIRREVLVEKGLEQRHLDKIEEIRAEQKRQTAEMYAKHGWGPVPEDDE